MNRVIWSVILASAITAEAAAQSRSITLQDFYAIETVNGAAISPDGRTVVYVRTFIVEKENRRHSEIWAVPADGSAAPRRLTNPAFSASAPRLSPDGSLLAFTSRRTYVDRGAGPVPADPYARGGSRRVVREEEYDAGPPPGAPPPP